MVEDDLALVPRLQFLHALVVGANDGQHLAVARGGLAIPFKSGGWQVAVSRVRCLLLPTLPGSLGTHALLFHRSVEAGLFKNDALIATSILDEVQRHTVGVV